MGKASDCAAGVVYALCALLLLAPLGVFVSGIILMPGAISNLDNAKARTFDGDFPVFGNVTVYALWNRPTLRRESCGEYCEVDVCYDDYVATFAWSGGPASGPFTVDGSHLWSRTDITCHDGPCDQFGGWRDVANLSASALNFTSFAVSQGWRTKRCVHGVGRTLTLTPTLTSTPTPT